jgi:hypothetical protein
MSKAKTLTPVLQLPFNPSGSHTYLCTCVVCGHTLLSDENNIALNSTRPTYQLFLHISKNFIKFPAHLRITVNLNIYKHPTLALASLYIFMSETCLVIYMLKVPCIGRHFHVITSLQLLLSTRRVWHLPRHFMHLFLPTINILDSIEKLNEHKFRWIGYRT